MVKIDKAMEILTDYRDELVEEIVVNEMTINYRIEEIEQIWQSRDHRDTEWMSEFIASVNDLQKEIAEYASNSQAESSVAKAQYDLTDNEMYLL